MKEHLEILLSIFISNISANFLLRGGAEPPNQGEQEGGGQPSWHEWRQRGREDRDKQQANSAPGNLRMEQFFFLYLQQTSRGRVRGLLS